MSDRRVTATKKDQDGDITALCNPGQLWSPRQKAGAIQDIESRLHTYYVDAAGRRTDVHVVADPDGKYLRTTGDSSSANNLDNLPACP